MDNMGSLVERLIPMQTIGHESIATTDISRIDETSAEVNFNPFTAVLL